MAPRPALRVDVAIIGCGPAGAALAAKCGARGLLVACYERRGSDEPGPDWHVDVPRWAFPAAGLPAPRGAEVVAVPERVHLRAGPEAHAPAVTVTVPAPGVVAVDTARYVERLTSMARGAGVLVRRGDPVARIRGPVVETAAGERVEAQTVVDASGLQGVQLLGHRLPRPQHLCVAAQASHALRDRGAALRFLARHGVAPGDRLALLGVAGGYSTLTLRLDPGSWWLSLLAGSVPAEGQPTAGQLLRGFIDDHPWVGRRLGGGGQTIPLHRPRDVLGRVHAAALGDAGCQVFGIHGSGVAEAFLAAAVLAEVLCERRPTHHYCVEYMRTRGGPLAAADLVRRFSQQLPLADLRRLMASGVLNRHTMGPALQSRIAPPALPGVLQAAAGATHAPRLAARLSRLGLRMAQVLAHYRRYPVEPGDLPRWQHGLQALGLRPDPIPEGLR